MRSNQEGKAFDHGSYHLPGVSHRLADRVSRYGYSKYMDADGDVAVQENVRFEGADASWKFVHGTPAGK